MLYIQWLSKKIGLVNETLIIIIILLKRPLKIVERKNTVRKLLNLKYDNYDIL